MRTDCPEKWSSQEIAFQCQQSTMSLSNGDISFVIPVTNIQTNITYGNKYCALCHGVIDYTLWSIKPSCGEMPSSLIQDKWSTSNPSPYVRVRRSSKPVYVSFKNREIKMDLKNLNEKIEDPVGRKTGSKFVHSLLKYLRRRRRKRDTKLNVDYNRYALKANEIWSVASYDARIGYFVSKYEEKNFICEVSVKLPSELKSNVRTCIPNLIEHCTNDNNVDAAQKCKTYTSIVYNRKDEKVYRNRDCAKCNNAPLEYLTGCSIILKQNPTF